MMTHMYSNIKDWFYSHISYLYAASLLDLTTRTVMEALGLSCDATYFIKAALIDIFVLT